LYNYISLASLQNVIAALVQHKKGKAYRPDGFHMDPFLFGCRVDSGPLS